MPIHSCTLPNGKQGYQWGQHGKCYASRADAEAQATAIYASGYAGKALKARLAKGDVPGHEFHGNQYSQNGDYVDRKVLAGHTYFKVGASVRQDSFEGAPAKVISMNEERHRPTTYTLAVDVSSHPEGVDENGERVSSKQIIITASRLLSLNPRPVQKIDLRSLLFKQQDLDHAAHDAATSPLNLKRPPTEAQAKAGNYPKGHVRFAGLDVSIENPAGSKRRPEWPPMQAHYGYVRGTEGADGDHVDVFLRPSTPVDWDGEAYVIDQVAEDGSFDEHKVMLGYADQEQAEKAYLSHYPADWKLGEVTAMNLDELKAWLEGDTTEPLKKDDGGSSTNTTTGHTQSGSPTSGITAYGMIRSTLRRKLKRKENRV
jgi:hypothetical protein